MSTYRPYESEGYNRRRRRESNPDRWIERSIQLGLCLSSVADYHYGASANSHYVSSLRKRGLVHGYKVTHQSRGLRARETAKSNPLL